MKKVTMADVANEIGVSKTTISRALNNKKDISKELKEDIILKCEQMGYYINSNARSLSSKETKTVGILSSESINDCGEFFYKEIYTNMVINLDNNDYTSILKVVSKKEMKEYIIPKFVKHQMVDGIIIIGELSKEYIKNIGKYDIPIVLCDFDLGDIKYDSVVTNNILSVSTITKMLIKEGYKDISFIGDDSLTSSILERYWGYKMIMKKHNLKVNQIIEKTTINQEPKFELSKLTSEVFICNNDYSAFRLIEFLKENSIKVPDEKRVIGFDNVLYSEICTPKISTVNVSRELIACESVRMLLKRIKSPLSPITNISLNAEFIKKQT